MENGNKGVDFEAGMKTQGDSGWSRGNPRQVSCSYDGRRCGSRVPVTPGGTLRTVFYRKGSLGWCWESSGGTWQREPYRPVTCGSRAVWVGARVSLSVCVCVWLRADTPVCLLQQGLVYTLQGSELHAPHVYLHLNDQSSLGPMGSPELLLKCWTMKKPHCTQPRVT